MTRKYTDSIRSIITTEAKYTTYGIAKQLNIYPSQVAREIKLIKGQALSFDSLPAEYKTVLDTLFGGDKTLIGSKEICEALGKTRLPKSVLDCLNSLALTGAIKRVSGGVGKPVTYRKG